MSRPEDFVVVESYTLLASGEWVRDYQSMTKQQLQNYADEIESERRIEKRGRRPTKQGK